ncbi:hypothetical protein VOLCADRAFT_100552 [Volvox carteri f. nagariensis]|uniref:Uncharacterized protein n=1 Tax=Volvox carteri f. nagariensis TaxID=3068 RepID=D8UKG6_VOLCA|nr:uncharacterized protein VOLCADRAFT_100552 [Volvox carteri f. nagariensis]EFJ39772.1 hypothetical protein VOLCADRAFT_100552 [Volvox carteri f. nagariensis]|eukprot:XP_002959149.1 hypothetical protein VOLCADRAFT_100552 [Volvox carteri f. nagariensis]
MFFQRSRNRGSRLSVPWLFRVQSIPKLLIILLALATFLVNFNYLNSVTRRYKDCTVPWITWAGGAGGLSALSVAPPGSDQIAGGGDGSSNGSTDRGRRLRIALVSMATGRASSRTAPPSSTSASAPPPPQQQRQRGGGGGEVVINARLAQFAGLLDVTGPNKQLFADLHGYTYVDASDLLDSSRPASWSKIPAVLSVLDQYDWVFWLDADTLITNLSTPVESLLPAIATPPPSGTEGVVAAAAAAGSSGSTSVYPGFGPDLLLTEDSTGVNAGVWLIRGSGCSWCRTFLERWWGMEEFIRRNPGDTKSGDNDALKYLLANMDKSELSAHVGLAPQCAFNSYLWRGSVRNIVRYILNPGRVLVGLWQPGDFLMHAAGVHDKAAVLQRFMQRQQLVGVTRSVTGVLSERPRAVQGEEGKGSTASSGPLTSQGGGAGGRGPSGSAVEVVTGVSEQGEGEGGLGGFPPAGPEGRGGGGSGVLQSSSSSLWGARELLRFAPSGTPASINPHDQQTRLAAGVPDETIDCVPLRPHPPREVVRREK